MSKIWKHGKKIKRKRNGLKVKTTCNSCNQPANLYECESIDELKIYGFVKIFDFSRVVMQCDKCEAVSKAGDHVEVKEAFEKRKQEEKDKEERQKELEQEKLRQEQEKKEQELRIQYEKEKAIQAKEIDKELEELKRQQEE